MLFGISDFFIAFGSPIDANIMDTFGFGGVPAEHSELSNFWCFIQEVSHFGKSYLGIWLDLERSDSLLFIINMTIENIKLFWRNVKSFAELRAGAKYQHRWKLRIDGLCFNEVWL